MTEMQALADPASRRVVVLATGGTIAGTAASATDLLGYRAAQLGVDALIRAVPALSAGSLEAEQVAQVDSKDMDADVWRALAARVAVHLLRPEVAGIVITHGTDTLEETAYLLQRLFAPVKPVVLTAAIRPATALEADGPQNLLDAVTLAASPGVRGVLAVAAGQVHGALELRKTHIHRFDFLGSGDAGPLARIEAGRLQQRRDWPVGEALGPALLDARPWPRVAIVLSHAGADGALVVALVAQGIDGIVAAGTGNATLHHALEAALLVAQARGVAVRCTSHVPDGAVQPSGHHPLPLSAAVTPQQARIELMLELMQRPRAARATSGGRGSGSGS